MCIPVAWGSQNWTSGPPELRYIDGFEPPYRCLESKARLLYKQQVLLTAELSLKPKSSLKKITCGSTKFHGSRVESVLFYALSYPVHTFCFAHLCNWSQMNDSLGKIIYLCS